MFYRCSLRSRYAFWILFGVLCVLPSPVIAYINLGGVNGDSYYTIYYEGAESGFTPLNASNLRIHKVSMSNSLSIMGNSIIQQYNDDVFTNGEDPGLFQSCPYFLFSDRDLRSEIIRNYRYIHSNDSTPIPPDAKIYCAPFGNSYNDGSFVVPATNFYIKVCLWPRSQNVEDTIFDFLIVVFCESALQVGVHTTYSNNTLVYDTYAQGEDEDLVLIRSPNDLTNKTYFYLVEPYFGSVDIKGWFGNTDALSITYIPPYPQLYISGFPFKLNRGDYVQRNAGYPIAYQGYSTSYTRRTVGTMQEFMVTFRLLHWLEDTYKNVHVGHGLFPAAMNPALYNSWQSYDRDNGQEPDASEYVFNHDREDPIDDYTGENNELVDLGVDTIEKLDRNTQAIVDKLEEVKDAIDDSGGPGQDTSPDLEEVTDLLDRAYGEGDDAPPTGPDEVAPEGIYEDPEDEELSLPDASTEVRQNLESWRSRTLIGPIVQGLEAGKNPTEGALPRVELPLTTQYGGNEPVYMDFNEIYDDSDIRSYFAIAKTIISLVIVGALAIFLTIEVANLVKG